jgi:hypothetical protein
MERKQHHRVQTSEQKGMHHQQIQHLGGNLKAFVEQFQLLLLYLKHPNCSVTGYYPNFPHPCNVNRCKIVTQEVDSCRGKSYSASFD